MSRAVMQQALEALEKGVCVDPEDSHRAIIALRAALAEPEQPVCAHGVGKTKCGFCKQPEQEPVALPCCGYTNASAVKWNPFNHVVQCHNCGQVYTAPTPRKPLPEQKGWFTVEELNDFATKLKEKAWKA